MLVSASCIVQQTDSSTSIFGLVASPVCAVSKKTASYAGGYASSSASYS